ncbi:MAG: hypothetical protein WD294_10585 [Phycisphaeraceae bacterium]
MPRPFKNDTRQARLLMRIYEAEQDPRSVAEGFDMTLEELAKWAGQQRTMHALKGLRLVADMQTQLILSRYRLTAAARLVQLANQDDSGELARKACVDLLKTELTFTTTETEEPTKADAPPISETQVLKALEELGRTSEKP